MTDKQRNYIESLLGKLEAQIQKTVDFYGEDWNTDEPLPEEKLMVEFNQKKIAFVKENIDKINASLLIDGLKNPYNPIWKKFGITMPESCK